MDSSNELGLMAILDGKMIGSAGIEAVGTPYKVRHCAESGISILKRLPAHGNRAYETGTVEFGFTELLHS